MYLILGVAFEPVDFSCDVFIPIMNHTDEQEKIATAKY